MCQTVIESDSVDFGSCYIQAGAPMEVSHGGPAGDHPALVEQALRRMFLAPQESVGEHDFYPKQTDSRRDKGQPRASHFDVTARCLETDSGHCSDRIDHLPSVRDASRCTNSHAG